MYLTPFGRTATSRLTMLRRGHLVRASSARARYLMARVLGRPRAELHEVPLEREVLSPEETLPQRPPRMPHGHLARIRSGFRGEAPERVVARLQDRERTHEATEALVLGDVTLLGDKLYAGRACLDLGAGRMPCWQEGESFDHVVLAATWAGSIWFGHCIHDDFPLTLLAEEHGLGVAPQRAPFRDELAYRGTFGVPQPHLAPCLFARRCTVLLDHAQNASKRTRYARMRRHLPRTGPRVRVYVRRHEGSRRAIREEAQLVERLDARGFTIVDGGRDSVARMVDLCTRTEQIVTIDGSHAAPALLLAPAGCELVDISPPQRVTDILLDIARATGLRTALYIGEHGERDGAFSVNVDDLVRFVEGLPG